MPAQPPDWWMHAEAQRPGIPADERRDIQSELQRMYAPTSSDLKDLPITQLSPQEIRTQILPRLDQIGIEQAWEGYEKSIIVHPTMGQEERKKVLGDQSSKAAFEDRMGIWGYDASGTTQRPSPIGYEMLKAIVENVPIFNACILTRIRQVQNFCAPTERESEPGYDVARVYSRKHAGKQDEKEQAFTRWMCKWFQNSGNVFSAVGRKKLKRDTMHALVAKSIRDTYTYDANPLNTVRDEFDKPIGLHALDGASIRLVTSIAEKVEGEEPSESKLREPDEGPFAVQVINSLPVATFYHDQLIFEPRNPRTDLRALGYGYPETEMLVRCATGYLNALNLNIRGQDENRIPPGLLLLFGDYNQQDLEHFRGQWNQLARGVSRRWVLPVLAAKNKDAGAEHLKFGMEFNEMYFARWMTFLTALICSIMGMDPQEVNFESFAVSKSSLSGQDTAEKLASSRDKGLEPLLSYYAGLFTDYIVNSYDDDYAFVWRGMHPERLEAHKAALQLVGTVNEYREAEGLDPIEDSEGWGGVPLNPAVAQYVAPNIKALQPPQMGMEQGAAMAGMDPQHAQQLSHMNPGTKPKPGMSDEEIAGLRGGAGGAPGATAAQPKQPGAPGQPSKAGGGLERTKLEGSGPGKFGKADLLAVPAGRFKKALIEIVE